MTIDALLIGEHKVTISKSGYSSEHLTVTVKEGECAELNVALAKLASNNSGQLTGNVSATDGTINGHEYVDLGLSIKWATCNVGATRPEEYGGYYAWGETEEKKNYEWNTYKWCNGRYDTMIKYCTSSSYGTVDNKTTLDLSDDAARVNWGGSWRMPTKAEQYELRDNCTWTWTTQNRVKGYKVTSKKNGNSIFLPAAGYRVDGSLFDAGSIGYYWSSSLETGYPYYAYFLGFYSSSVDVDYCYRCFRHSVRPVCQ
jgi:hypothetical protein